MKNQVFNPYLPLYEYVPDGEPHLFDGRVYIYGSHDFAGGSKYCPGDYVTWSAPEDDLSDWRYEGVIYRRGQDPSNADGALEMWAPDVARAPDGRYYLFYCHAFLPEIGVAVADSPVGPFAFHGHVRYPANMQKGKTLNEHLPFDPAVLVDDDGRIYLYYGFSPVKAMPEPDAEAIRAMGRDPQQVLALVDMINRHASPGAMVVELEPDMLTMKAEPKMCVPGGKIAAGTDFEGHAFYEASSIRKVGGRYVFVYSSQLSHELCYAESAYPDREFAFGGPLVSNADIGMNGSDKPVNMAGNNHGGLVCANGVWFIFYHRQTHGTEASRQGCAERVRILPDGRIPQVEITSCGLNDGPLSGKGTYPAAICCHLTSESRMEKVQYGAARSQEQPCILEEACGVDETEHEQFVANIRDGVTVGFKYFDMKGLTEISLLLKGEADGEICVLVDSPEGEAVAKISVSIKTEEWTRLSLPVQVTDGVHALYFTCRGDGALSFKEFTLA